MSSDVSDLLQAALLLWPSQAGPEAAVKRTAAEFLLSQPGQSAKCAVVASHVTSTVGKISTLGISKKFEQLLNEDPSFDVDKSASNSVVTLNGAQLLSQASWKQDEQQAQQQQDEQQQQGYNWQAYSVPAPEQSSGSGTGVYIRQDQASAFPAAPAAGGSWAHANGSGNSSAGGGGGETSNNSGFLLRPTPRLLQGLEEAWPLNGPKATAGSKVKNRALMHLVNTPQHSMPRTALVAAVKAALGDAYLQGSTKSFSQLLREESEVFVLRPGNPPCELVVSLNVQGVLSMFVRQQYRKTHTPQQQQQQQQVPVVRVVPRRQPLQQPSTQQQQQQVPAVRVVPRQQPMQQPSTQQQHHEHQAPAVQAPPQQRAVRQQQQQLDIHHDNVYSSVAATGVVSAAALLHYVRSRVWHSSQVLHTVRRAFAERLVLKANPAASGSPAERQRPASTEAKSYTMLGAMAGYTIMQALAPTAAQQQPSLEDVVNQDPYLGMDFVGDVQHIKLDIEQLLQDVAAAAAAAAGGSAPQQQQRQCAAGANGVDHSAASSSRHSQHAAAAGTAAACDAATAAAPTAAAGTAGQGEGGGVTVSALLELVRGRVWHSSNEQSNLARRALAENMVNVANTAGFIPDSDARTAANLDPQAYTMTYAVAGTVIDKALRGAYGPSFEPCFKKSKRFFEDEPLFRCWASHGTSQRSIQLNLGQLLRELPGSSAAAAAAPLAAAAGASAMVRSLPAAAAAAAAGAGQGGVSVAALLHWVDSRVWHSSSPQLDLARRSLAKYLVHKANPGAAESPAAAVPINPDESAYTDSYSTSGHEMNKAIKEHFSPDQQHFYKKLSDVFEGDPCWISLPPSQAGAHKHVRLNMALLLQEAAQAAADSSSSSSSGEVSKLAAVLMDRTSASPAAAGSKVQVAASPAASSSGSSSKPSVIASPAAAAASGAGATEAALAAIKAAAKSLMPPPVKSPAAPRVPAAVSSATAAAADGGGDGQLESSSAAAAPAAVENDSAAPAAEVAAVVPPAAAAAPAVQPSSFLPPWLQLARTAAAAEQQQQQQQQVLSVSSHGPEQVAGIAPSQQQQQQQQKQLQLHLQVVTGSAGDTPAVQSSAAAGESAEGPDADVPLLYELVLSNSVPGWYTASYIPYEGTAVHKSAANNAHPVSRNSSSSFESHADSGAAVDVGAAVEAVGDSAAASRSAADDLIESAAEAAGEGEAVISSDGAGRPAAVAAAIVERMEESTGASVEGQLTPDAAEAELSPDLQQVLESIQQGTQELSDKMDATTAHVQSQLKGVTGGLQESPGKDDSSSGSSSSSNNSSSGNKREALEPAPLTADTAAVAPVAAENAAGNEGVSPLAATEMGGVGTAAAVSSAAAAATAEDAGDAAAVEPRLDAEVLALLEALPARLRPILHPFLARRPSSQQQQQEQSHPQPHVTHILLDKSCPVTLRLSDRSAVTLNDTHMSLSEALTHLVAVQQVWIEQQLLQQGVVSGASGDQRMNGGSSGDGERSAAAAADAAASAAAGMVNGANGCAGACMNGDLSSPDQSRQLSSALDSKAAAAAAAEGGLFGAVLQAAAHNLFGPDLSRCVGVPRTCHRVCAVPDAAGGIAGLTYCLERTAASVGTADSLADVLSGMKASLVAQTAGFDRPHSLVVLGGPGVNKLGLLRDMCRLMSDRPDQGGLGLHVMLLDTTGQIAGISSRASPDIGRTRCLAVPDRSQQAQLLERTALDHQPDVLVVGELATQQEVTAAVHIARSHNMVLVAAAPATDLRAVLQDNELCQLAGCVHLSSSSCAGQPVLQRARQAPFVAAVEMLSNGRLRIHCNLQASSDELVKQLNSSSSSSSNSSSSLGKRATAPLSDAVGAHAQLRSRDPAGRLVVQFGSAAAAGNALAEAAVVETLAWDSVRASIGSD